MGMRAGKRGVATDAFEPHRRADLPGEPHQIIDGTCARDGIAHHNHRRTRSEYQRAHLLHGQRIRCGRTVQTSRRLRGVVRLLLHHVDRQRDKHRPIRWIIGDLERAPQYLVHLIRALHLRAPFGDRRRHRDEVMREDRVAPQHARVLLAGSDDHRRVGLECVVEHADAIAQAGRGMQVDHAGAAAGARVVARCTDGDAFMQGHHVVDRRHIAERIEQRAFGGARIAEDVPHAMQHQALNEDITSAHRKLHRWCQKAAW